jgi:hypothetical protein
MNTKTSKTPSKKRRSLKGRLNFKPLKKVTPSKSYWSCDACGGDSYTGCQLSDPQNCVRG